MSLSVSFSRARPTLSPSSPRKARLGFFEGGNTGRRALALPVGDARAPFGLPFSPQRDASNRALIVEPRRSASENVRGWREPGPARKSSRPERFSFGRQRRTEARAFAGDLLDRAPIAV